MNLHRIRKLLLTAFIFMLFVICFSFSTQAAMSESEVRSRLSSYSESITKYEDSTLYIDYPKWDINQEEMYYVISDMAESLMGEPVDDYCQVSVRFYYKAGTHGNDLETFGDYLFKYKKALGNFWTDWSRYNKMEMIVTSHNRGEKYSACATLKLNGSEGEMGEAYTKKLLSIINEAKSTCTTDRQMVDYFLKWLHDNVVYRYYTGWTNDPYYALVRGKTVCGGYANAFKDLCNAVGIPATVPVNEKENHAWSQVYVDGTWYTADLCEVVKSKSGTYSGFLFTDPDLEFDCNNFVESHKKEYVSSFDAVKTTNISTCTFTYNKTAKYTGKAITPALTVTHNGKTLTAGTHYTVTCSANTLPGSAFITVEGIRKNGYGGKTTLEFTISLPSPSSLTAKAEKSSVTLSWKKVSGASGYIIRIYDDKTGRYTDLSKVEGTSCKVNDLASGKSYTFAVKAYVSSSAGDHESEQKKVSFVTKPDKVRGLKISSVKDTSLKLKWSAAETATKYDIYISTDGKKWEKKASTSKTAYTVKSLKANKKYYFKVRAVNESGNGSFSSKKSKVTLLAAPKVTLTAKDDSLVVKWNKVSGAKGYVIYYSTDSEMVGSQKITVKGKSKVKAVIPSLKSNKKYYVRVKAYKTSDGEKIYGKYSSTVNMKTK